MSSTSAWSHSRLSSQTHPGRNYFEASPSSRCCLPTCWTGSWAHPWLTSRPCAAAAPPPDDDDQPWLMTTAERSSMTTMAGERDYCWRSRALAHNPLGFALNQAAGQRKCCSCQWGEAVKLWLLLRQYCSCYSLWAALQLLPYSCRKPYTRPSPPVYIKDSDNDETTCMCIKWNSEKCCF